MRSLEGFTGASLWWHAKKSPLNQVYELLGDDGEMYGRLSAKGLFLHCRAQAEMEGARYDLKWAFVIRRGASIANSHTKEKVGELRLGILDRGEFTLLAGTRYRFRRSFWRSRITVTDDLGEVLFTLIPGVFKPSVKVVLGTGLTGHRDLPPLVAASQYALVMLMYEGA